MTKTSSELKVGDWIEAYPEGTKEMKQCRFEVTKVQRFKSFSIARFRNTISNGEPWLDRRVYLPEDTIECL